MAQKCVLRDVGRDDACKLPEELSGRTFPSFAAALAGMNQETLRVACGW